MTASMRGMEIVEPIVALEQDKHESGAQEIMGLTSPTPYEMSKAGEVTSACRVYNVL